MSTPDLRKRWRQFWLESNRICNENNRLRDAHHKAFLKAYATGQPFPPEPQLEDSQEFPDEFRGMTCGARTRAGTACKRKDLYLSGRCKLHGGMSTGPRTKRGKRKASRNGRQPKRKKRTL